MKKIVICEFDPRAKKGKAAKWIRRWANLLYFDSWGSKKDPYPKKAMEEIPYVLVAYAAFVDGKFAGAAAVTDVHSSPDGQDRDAMYFALAVVDRKYRNHGIWELLYAERMKWIQGRPGRVVSTGEDFANMRRLFDRGWKLLRMGRNEKGDSFLALELPRK